LRRPKEQHVPWSLAFNEDMLSHRHSTPSPPYLHTMRKAEPNRHWPAFCALCVFAMANRIQDAITHMAAPIFIVIVFGGDVRSIVLVNSLTPVVALVQQMTLPLLLHKFSILNLLLSILVTRSLADVIYMIVCKQSNPTLGILGIGFVSIAHAAVAGNELLTYLWMSNNLSARTQLAWMPLYNASLETSAILAPLVFNRAVSLFGTRHGMLIVLVCSLCAYVVSAVLLLRQFGNAGARPAPQRTNGAALSQLKWPWVIIVLAYLKTHSISAVGLFLFCRLEA